MTMLRSLTRKSTIGLASVALLGGGMVATSATAAAEEGPIEPADAPEIMDRPWPEYPDDAETHVNIVVGTTILGAETDDDGNPYFGEHPTNAYSPVVEDAVLRYQEDKGLGEHGQMKEEFWGYLDDLQFDENIPNPSWGPAEPRWYYDNGDQGAGPEAIQAILIDQGYLEPEDLDGYYGPDTMAAVEEFQRDNVCDDVVATAQSGCDDGWVGTVTWRAMITAD